MKKLHVVNKGDTLWGIARCYHVTVQDLVKWNNIPSSKINHLKIGQKIYLYDNSDNDSNYETELRIDIMDLAFKPILKATLKLEYDGQIKTVTTTNGKFENIYIKNHEKGLKVYFKNIKGTFDLIADHKKLPTGKKVIRLTSRMIKVKGNTHVKEGAKQYTVTDILSDLKKMGQPVLDGLGKVLDGARDNKNVKNKDIPKATDQQMRTDNGNKTHVVSFQFTEDNFLLTPINNVYRSYIIASAKKYGLTPHALAALINAEAAKTKDGQWNANSKAQSTTAAGLTQFLSDTWLDMANNKSTLIGKYKNENPSASKEKILNLRFKPEMSIDAAGAYAIHNFKASGLDYKRLKEPSSIAKLAYLLHHEGATGGSHFVNNKISEERSKKLLYKQFGKNGQKTADGYIKKYGSAKVAYIEWLSTYIDTKIRVLHYVPDSKKTSLKEVSMRDTIKVLKGEKSSVQNSAKNQTAEKPNNTTQAKLEETKQKTVVNNSPQLPETTPAVGGSNTWCDPLAINKLRTAGLQSVKSATFGKVRNGGTTNHQGIDLAANIGTDMYAVCNGKVVYAGDSGGAYGKVVILAVNKNDLPLKQRNYVAKFIKTDEVFFFYAHLSSIFVSSANIINAKTIIGKTGDTGNAKGMTTIARGGHLHFEVRSAKSLGKGLVGRFDPIPLFLTKLL